MKKLNYLLLGAAGLALASCSQEEIVSGGLNPDGTANVTISLNTPQIQTRAYSDGTTATKLQFAVYEVDNSTGTSTLTLIDKPDYYSENAQTADDLKTINIKKQMNFKLLTDHTYQFFFWAESADDANGSTNPYTVTFGDAAAPELTINYTDVKANDENLDAFYGRTAEVKVTGNLELSVDLIRPFAQVNVGTNDYYESNELGYKPTQSTMTITNAYTKLNLLTDKADSKSTVAITFDYNDIASVTTTSNPAVGSEIFPVPGYEYLAMAYVLVGEDKTEAGSKDNVTVTFDHKDDSSDLGHLRTISAVPVQRNHRTNIYGQVLTSDAALNIEIKPAYDDPDLERHEIHYVGKIGGTYTLESDMTYPDDDIVLVRKDMILDLNGYTISANPEEWYGFINAIGDANLLIKGDGKMINTSTESTHSILVYAVYGATITIESGYFESMGGGEMIYISETGGTIFIKGGTFKNNDSDGLILNCGGTSYADGIANFIVTGGTFWNFDPSNVPEKDANGNNANYVPEGYISVPSVDENGDTWYTVVPEDVILVTADDLASTTFDEDGTYYLSGTINTNTTIKFAPEKDIVFDGSLLKVEESAQLNVQFTGYFTDNTKDVQDPSLRKGEVTFTNLKDAVLSVKAGNTTINIVNNQLKALDVAGGNIALNISNNVFDGEGKKYPRYDNQNAIQYDCAYLYIVGYDLKFDNNTLTNDNSGPITINGWANNGADWANLKDVNKISSFTNNTIKIKGAEASADDTLAAIMFMGDGTYYWVKDTDTFSSAAQEFMNNFSDSNIITNDSEFETVYKFKFTECGDWGSKEAVEVK